MVSEPGLYPAVLDAHIRTQMNRIHSVLIAYRTEIVSNDFGGGHRTMVFEGRMVLVSLALCDLLCWSAVKYLVASMRQSGMMRWVVLMVPHIQQQ